MRQNGLATLAAAAIASVGAPALASAANEVWEGRRYGPKRSGSIAQLNRHTFQPHEHKREIARRARQQKRLHDTYMLNGGFSRRGNEVGPVAA